MSQENVAVVKALFEAWNAGDMDAVRELYDPHVIVREMEDWPEPGPFVGREAVMRQWEVMREAWDADELKLITKKIKTLADSGPLSMDQLDSLLREWVVA